MSLKVKKSDPAPKDSPQTPKPSATGQSAAGQSTAEQSAAEHRRQHPLLALREDVDHLFENFFSGFALGPFGEFGRGGKHSEPFRRIEDAFAGIGSGLGTAMGKLHIIADMHETDDSYRIEAELPGFSEDAIEISAADGLLTVRGQKKDANKQNRKNYHLSERHYGSVTRIFPLPDTLDVSKSVATYTNGVLIVTVPKKVINKAKAKKIPISGP